MATRRSKALNQALVEHRAPNRASISGRMARKLMKKARVGSRQGFKVRGKVSSVSSNEYDDRIEMDMDHCEPYEDDEGPKSLTQAIKRRRIRDGRYA